MRLVLSSPVVAIRRQFVEDLFFDRFDSLELFSQIFFHFSGSWRGARNRLALPLLPLPSSFLEPVPQAPSRQAVFSVVCFDGLSKFGRHFLGTSQRKNRR